MSSTRRIPFVLNLDDPLDAAIWDAVGPMLSRHRASAFIRAAVAQSLGLVVTSTLMPPAPPLNLPVVTDEPMRAKRPKRAMSPENTIERVASDEDNADSLNAAATNFLNAFS